MDSTRLLEVLAAFRKGDFSQRMPMDETGVAGKICDALNDIIDMNQNQSQEFVRVAELVGREGRFTQRTAVGGAAGAWADSINAVNTLIDDLVQPSTEIARVISAVAKGDLSQKMAVEIEGRAVTGEFLQAANNLNAMVDQLRAFASEVTRVAQEVGTDGKLGGQAQVEGVSGTWQDLTENVNAMASNLTAQVRDIATVATAVANGDLTQKVSVIVKGEVEDLKNTINTMVDQLSSFASEVTRVALEVGTDGKLGGQAQVVGVSGTWQDLTENVNAMASNLTAQVRDIATVATAVANGDLTQKVSVDVKGEVEDLKNTINTMVDQLSSFASEVTRVALEVGTDGKLGGQAQVEGVSGTWQDLTENVNAMASNLTAQVRDIATVTSAVANGDLTQKISVDVKGEVEDLKNTINTMVDQLSSFSSEVTRVALEVGTEGKLGGQAQVEGVSGTWQDLTNNVNAMAQNLTDQVRDIATVATAVANGDLTQKVTVDVKGEIEDLKTTINTMVDQLSSFASEVTRVALEVGTDGKLGGQARVEGVSGTWQDLTENVNAMAGNLTAQVRDIATVATAVANGDLTQKVTVDVKGEIEDLKTTINTMVDQLSSFSSEVTRVALEVGTEGKLGGQAQVEGVRGTWQDLTENVNAMANNLTDQVRDIATVATAVANGDLTQKVSVNVKGEVEDLKNTINTMVDQLSSFASEVTRVALEVGTDGKLGGQAQVEGVSGTWQDLTENVNAMASNLTAQVRDIATVATAVANGDLNRKITVEVSGEILDLKNILNAMVDQLNTFADEVTRVARDVGTEGKLGVQAEVRAASGTWRDLTDNVNTMASNLTDQVRGISKVVTGVADGDLTQEIRLDARGEVAELVNVVNSMIRTLAIFGDEVTRVAREVGVQGELGGQADVPGAKGTWRELTDNVNELAGNLTTQVRAIADVATAVSEGDLTRAIEVEARGEVAALAGNINQMVRSLAETSQVNTEQDWLKTSLATLTRITSGANDLKAVTDQLLRELAPMISMQHGVVYLAESEENRPTQLTLSATYAFKNRKHLSNGFQIGEGLVGQCAAEKKRIMLTDVPNDYIQINSGLGEATPLNICVLPVLFEGELLAVIELASFSRYSETQVAFLDQMTEALGVGFNAITATQRSEELLKESQSLTEELQSQQEELTQTNEELEEKARVVEDQKKDVERKNQQVETAKADIEEKARQLELTSRYKSEFLANMSHELRTPLNSLLILAKTLSDNPDENLTTKQVEYAETIHGSGADLLSLINEILDLSKIESGIMAVEARDESFNDIKGNTERNFRQVADEKKLRFVIELDAALPRSIHTDPDRLLQVLKNLLSNAFKFTDVGEVALRIAPATSGWGNDRDSLNHAASVVAFSVSDTGLGISEDQQKIIFEAFQQADGGTSRKYGGTGLGLSISREIARLLGGEIRLISQPGHGSTFTLYLPISYTPPTNGPGGGWGGGPGRGGQPTAGPTGSVRVSDPAETADRRSPTQARHASEGLPADQWRPSVADVTRSGDRATTSATTTAEPAPLPAGIADDRNNIQPGDRVVLLVEDDVKFAHILLERAHQQEFKALVALTGDTALALARKFRPDAVSLDIRLPDMDGWLVLDRLKHDSDLRHIPVHVVSGAEDLQRGLKNGAVACLQKPVEQEQLSEVFAKMDQFLDCKVKQLLLVEDDDTQRKALIELIGDGDVHITPIDSGREALAALAERTYDCVVLDLGLPDMSGFDLIEKIHKDLGLTQLPIIVYTGRELTRDEETRLKAVTETIIVKDVASPERLLDETTLFLHRVEANLPKAKRKMLKQVHDSDPALAGRKVLVVDDDVRNIFALTTLLERHKMHVVYAESGKDGIDVLRNNPDVGIVLMDIMMPDMDGYETMSTIRRDAKFERTPIIALTAKAMKGDREKCIAAGASDYISKPVDTDQLLSLLRVWLYR